MCGCLNCPNIIVRMGEKVRVCMFSLLYCVYICMTFVRALLCVCSLCLHLDCVCIWIDHTPVCVHVHVCACA